MEALRKKSSYKRKVCRLCSSGSLKSVLKLNPTPPANAFVSEDNLKEIQNKYPLELFFCEDCYHLQLLEVVDPAELFRNYVYVSGTSPLFVNHFDNYAEEIFKKYINTEDEFVVDIGSNDGTLLKSFKKLGCRVLGVDPAYQIATKATNEGIETLPDFFTYELSQIIKNKFSSAAVISANNVFAHADDLVGILKGVKNLLKDDGIFVFEVSYLLDVFQKTLFDTIYHEHLSYHSVKPLVKFFKSNGMKLIDAKRVNTHGGSIRCAVQLSQGKLLKNSSVDDLIKIEEELKIDKYQTWLNYSNKIKKIENQLSELLNKIKSKGKTIAAFGAPAKATTLMYQFNLNQNYIDFIIDDSPLKQGLYSPGLHIPVFSSMAIKEKKPDYLIILAWNFADPIIKKNQEFLLEGGHFIIPLPEVKVI